MNLFLVAGEASGDTRGAEVMSAALSPYAGSDGNPGSKLGLKIGVRD